MCLGFESNEPCAFFLIECWECVSPLDDEGDDEDDDQCFCRTKMADSSSPAAGLVLNAREEVFRKKLVDKSWRRSEAGWLQEM